LPTAVSALDHRGQGFRKSERTSATNLHSLEDKKKVILRNRKEKHVKTGRKVPQVKARIFIEEVLDGNIHTGAALTLGGGKLVGRFGK